MAGNLKYYLLYIVMLSIYLGDVVCRLITLSNSLNFRRIKQLYLYLLNHIQVPCN